MADACMHSYICTRSSHLKTCSLSMRPLENMLNHGKLVVQGPLYLLAGCNYMSCKMKWLMRALRLKFCLVQQHHNQAYTYYLCDPTNITHQPNSHWHWCNCWYINQFEMAWLCLVACQLILVKTDHLWHNYHNYTVKSTALQTALTLFPFIC